MMKRHVFLTGEVGAGKSTALQKTLSLLDARAEGVQTYCEDAGEPGARLLYLRAWGDAGKGTLLTRLPEKDASRVAAAFDGEGSALLARAMDCAQVIVIDECGRLEREAAQYQRMLLRCLDGDTPVLCAIRKHRAPWADWVRMHPAVTLMEVTRENRDELPHAAAALLRRALLDAEHNGA